MPATHSKPTALGITDIALSVFSFASPFELYATLTLVSRRWKKLIDKHKAIHAEHLEALWRNKRFVHSAAAQLARTDPRTAFKISVIDRARNLIRIDELVGLEWNIEWRVDAFSNESADRVTCRFHRDGKVTQKAAGGLFTWKFVDEPAANAIGAYPSFLFLDAPEQQQQPAAPQVPSNAGWQEGEDASNEARWIQINYFPPMIVSRNPVTWGWKLESSICVFHSL